MLIVIAIPVLCVAVILLAQTIHLRIRNTILWKRSYPDWSIVHTLVTLPENAIPEVGTNLNRFDVVISFIGVILFAPTILQWNHPFGYVIGVPTAILLIARIKLTIGKLDEDKEPYENSRWEFGVNFSLLFILNLSTNFFYNPFHVPYHYTIISFMIPFILIFIILFGSVLLFQLVTGAQNLWWTTEKSETEKQKSIKKPITKDMLRDGATLLVKLIGWIIVSDSIIVYSTLAFAPEELSALYFNRLAGLVASIVVSTVLAIGYCIIRFIRIRNFNSIAFIGRRTRLEALVDSIVSIFLVSMTAIYALGTLSTSTYFPVYTIIHVYPNIFNINISIAGVVVGMEFLLLLLIVVAFIQRLYGNFLEFFSERKIDAANKSEKSGKLMLLILSFIAGGELVNYIGMISPWYFMVNQLYFMFMLMITFIAFQIVSAELKIRELKEMKDSIKEQEIPSLAGNNNQSTSITQ
jgi:hypothetical protein